MKQLIIKSDSPAEDRQAAFTIMQECNDDPNLKKITWYSNIAALVSTLEKRFDTVDSNLAQREKEFKWATKAAFKAADRVSSIELELKNLKEKMAELLARKRSKPAEIKKEVKEKE